MTIEDARKVALTVAEADNGCTTCVNALVRLCRQHWPEFDWRGPREHADDYRGPMVEVFEKAIGVALVLLWLAAPAAADSITATVRGCGPLPVGASWVGSTAGGFVFMAYHDPMAGCEETTKGATSGTHIAYVNPDGFYQVDVLAALLPTCGRIQYDAQAYTSTGLDPTQLHTYVYDTGVDCSQPRQTAIGGSPLSYYLPPPDAPDDPDVVFVACTGCADPLPVPEPATLALFGVGLLGLWRRSR